MSENNIKRVQDLIEIWSMRPAPNTPEGDAWESGCIQGYQWGIEEHGATKDSKQRFDELINGDTTLSAIDRLRLFCSVAMTGKDLEEAEFFFDDLRKELKK